MNNKTLEQLYKEHRGKVSDRWSIYLSEYERLFSDYRDRPIRLLEIGIQNGGSLEIWSKFFPCAEKFVGCDINLDCARLQYEDSRIAIVVADANTDETQRRILEQSPVFDLIIDDGSHQSSDIVRSFARYFTHLNDGGLYVVEDLHCSYWQEFDGGIFQPYSSIAFFKCLVDVVNHEHWGIEKKRRELLRSFSRKYGVSFDETLLCHVHSVEFFNSVCVIRKTHPISNVLGNRVIAGTMEVVVPGHLPLRGSSSSKPNQTENQWTVRDMPVEEELLMYLQKVNNLRQAVSERDRQIASLNQAVAERDEQITRLNRSIAEHDGRIDNLNRTVTARDGQINNLNQAVAIRDERIAVILNSRSWRITRPLRIMGDAIKAISTGRWQVAGYAHHTPRVIKSIVRVLRQNPKLINNFFKEVRLRGYKYAIEKARAKIHRVAVTNLKHEKNKQLSDVLDLLLAKPYIPTVSVEQPIDIIIPVYNGREFLDALFASILKNTFVPYRLLIANDNSTDQGISIYLANLKKNNPNIDITIIENSDNLGFVKTVNKLAKLTKSNFVILNTDVEVPPHWLERLMYPILEKDKIASTTPFTNAGTICSFPNFLEDNPIFESMDVADLDSFFQYVDFEKNYLELPTGIGFCMGINKIVYDKIGMFDEIFGKGYGEENDWCMRSIKLGYKNIIVPNLFVYHKHGGSFSGEEKKRLIDDNLRLLQSKHPNYFQLVEEFINNDYLMLLRKILTIKILSGMHKPKLIIDHSIGGGANEYTKTLLSKEEIAIVVSYNMELGNYIIAFCRQNTDGIYCTVENIKKVEQVIGCFCVKEIVINNLVSHAKVLNLLDFLLEIKRKKSDIDFTFLVHDFFCICPMYNLLSYEIKYCNVPSDFNYCDNCMQINPLIKGQVPFVQHDYPNLTIALWRDKFGKILEHASKIVCFSHNSKQIVQACYQGLSKDKFEVSPHVVGWVRPVAIKKTSEKINIAIIGNLTIHKGAHVVALLANFIEYHELNMKIHIFGDILEPYESFDFIKTVVKYGKYEKTDLPRLMEDNEIDIVFIPSIWPETFSYTSEEAMKMQLPIAVFDLGAPAERVKLYERGIILQSKDPEYMVRTICKYFKKNISLNIRKSDTVFVCVSNNDLVYSRAVLSSAYITEHKVLKYNNIDENIPIPVRYNNAIDKLLTSNYNGWIFFIHNDFSIMEPVENIVDKLEHNHLYGPIGAILEKNEKSVYGEIFQGHNDLLICHGSKIEAPTLVDTVDCQCLFLHTDLIKEYNLRFDENIVLSFHQYVEDFCINANYNHGIRTYAVPMKCKHFSWGKLNKDFYLAIDYINSKYPNKKWAGTCTHL